MIAVLQDQCTSTSSPAIFSAMRKAVCQGIASSRWPWMMRTGQSMANWPAAAPGSCGRLRSELAADAIRPVVIFAGNFDHALRSSASLRAARREMGHIRSSVKSGPGAIPTSAGDTRRARHCGFYHDPAAHARPHQNLRAFSEFVQDGERVVRPAADAAVFEPPRRVAVAEHVEATIPDSRGSRSGRRIASALLPPRSDIRPCRRQRPRRRAGPR